MNRSTPTAETSMIITCDTDEQIASTYPVMRQLRPHTTEADYLPTVRRMMESEGFRLAAALESGQVRAVAGYRLMEMLYCGRILYVDDLVTDEAARSTGLGKHLLSWLKDEGRRQGCTQIHLDSRVTRADAHRFYFREGMPVLAFHFAADLAPAA
jgi:GNAT superfamily N-acetyltransferase